jgi:hypothetical protein
MNAAVAHPAERDHGKIEVLGSSPSGGSKVAVPWCRGTVLGADHGEIWPGQKISSGESVNFVLPANGPYAVVAQLAERLLAKQEVRRFESGQPLVIKPLSRPESWMLLPLRVPAAGRGLQA